MNTCDDGANDGTIYIYMYICVCSLVMAHFRQLEVCYCRCAMAGVGLSTLRLGWFVCRLHVYKQVPKRPSLLRHHGTPMMAHLISQCRRNWH